MDDNELINQKKEKTVLLSEWQPQKINIARKDIDDDELLNHLRQTHFDKTGPGFPFFQKGVFWASIGENIGPEINRTRPIVILSKTPFNLGGTIVVAPLTTGPIRNDREIRPYQYKLFQYKYPGLERDSVVKLDQIKTISVSRLLNNKYDSIDTTPLDEIKPITIINTTDWNSIKARIKNLIF